MGAFLTPGSGIWDPGWEKLKSASGSGIRDEQPGSYFLELRNHFFAFFGVKILKFFDEDPGSGMETVRTDPGWKKVGSGIRDKHPGSATLVPIQSEIYRPRQSQNYTVNILASVADPASGAFFTLDLDPG